jgi:hypothetical protein
MRSLRKFLFRWLQVGLSTSKNWESTISVSLLKTWMKIRRSWKTCKNHGRKSSRRKRKEIGSTLNRHQLKKRIKGFLT